MRRQISWLVLATTSAVVVSFVIPLCLLVRTMAEDRALAAADQEARSAAILVAGLAGDRRLGAFIRELDTQGTPGTSVLTSTGRVLGAPRDMAGDPEVRRAMQGSAFRVLDDSGARILLPVVGADGTAVVRTSVTLEETREGVMRAWVSIWGLGALLLIASLMIARWLSNRVSRPLVEVAAVAHRLRGGEMGARAAVDGTGETRELAQALNGLADRTTELLATERAAVGDLSHRLRTPVTALRLDAEAVRDPSLADRMLGHVDVLQNTIDQIVKEARRPVRSDLAAHCDLVSAVRTRIDFWSVLAIEQNRTVETHFPSTTLTVPLAESDLTDLVDILIDNIFAHTPEGTDFSVTVQRVEDTGLLVVSDSGPGLSAGPTTRPGSTGLGLDIVRRTVHEAGGTLTMSPRGRPGTHVEISLPLTA